MISSSISAVLGRIIHDGVGSSGYKYEYRIRLQQPAAPVVGESADGQGSDDHLNETDDGDKENSQPSKKKRKLNSNARTQRVATIQNKCRELYNQDPCIEMVFMCKLPGSDSWTACLYGAPKPSTDT